MGRESDQLRLLSIFHYIAGGILLLFCLLQVFSLLQGISLVRGPFGALDDLGSSFPSSVGWFFVAWPATMIVGGLILANCVVLAGRNIAQRSSYMYCMVIAGIECMIVPYATALGVFTIIVLMQPSVREMFALDDGGDAEDGDAEDGDAEDGDAEDGGDTRP